MRYACLFFICAVCISAAASSTGGRTPSPSATEPQTWAEKMAQSEMERRGDSLSSGKNARGSWAYETGVFLKGLEHLWVKTENAKYYEYLKA